MSFQIALSALQSINTQLDTISNNIANTGTTGYKSSRTNFSAMYASQAPNGVQASSNTQTMDVNGGLLSTGRNLDVAIGGKGYFMVKDSTGATNYTRTGIFNVDATGNLVDHLGRKVQGYSMEPGSNALGAFGGLTVPTGQIPAEASTKVDFVGNFSADWEVIPAANAFKTPLDLANGEVPALNSYNSSTVSVAYDSMGKQHTITQYFSKTAEGVVDVHYIVDGETQLGPHTIPFTTTGQIMTVDANGVATNAESFTLNFTPTGAEPMNLQIMYTGTTQFAGDTSTTTNAANGSASGAMVNVQIGEDGAINVQYSNGMKQRVGMLGLATFPNEGGLSAVDGTSWQASAVSGAALIGTPGTGQLGALASGQLEQSNVELATELVDLMGAQRNYQANTKVISTSNGIMQSLMQAI